MKSSTRQATEAEEKIIFRVLGVLFLIGSMAALVYGISEIKEGLAAKNWPTSEGKIISSGTRWQNMSTSGGSSTLIAEVVYEYRVNDRLFQGDRISMGQFGSKDADHAKQEAAQYPENSLVTVYFDPDDPSKALLEPGWGWISLISLLVGLSVLIAAIFLLRQGFRKKTRREFG